MLPYQRRKNNWFAKILYYKASVKELKKYIESFEDKESLLPEILEITGTKVSDEKLKNQIDETLINKINEALKNQVNEILKDPLDEINNLIKLIKNKELE
ncbi:hypothetical protein F8M41_009404 [Gigaspora margarita]|uniref:Uncharacterized protein n=1 Tax=Gigaspora margarita TaxID=4874 RepID=A0A8H4AV40_GIGMA|nr:hypothetical protein F8M41_009404 [Gigaspora margarita]